jgi:hypothetical protein
MQKQGMKIAALDDRPSLDLPQSYYFGVFVELSRSRGSGMNGPLPIPLSEIKAYCELYGIDCIEDRGRIAKFVGTLDEQYLESAYKKIAEAQKK